MKKSSAETVVVVESPTKAKTIGAFLGKGFTVTSSYGHVRDLPKGELGVDVEGNFEPRYVIPTSARKHVSELKRLVSKADRVILATDEDRYGFVAGHGRVDGVHVRLSYSRRGS